ncbi:UNVERIFIED_CONTAM: hypothetical protein FKN15_062652 [Acipenser sinensis]
MNNLDQNPLNCQSSSRISPARSTSSIDQFTHHHGKGDSAYSSFSGGSNAPDYSSPCLPEEMHSHSLQYVDDKYVRAVFNPNVLNPDPKGMDHLYKSMETFNMQCHQDFNTQSATNQGYKEPPQPPARMDSFITIRNLENTKLCQGPEGQLQQRTQTVSRPEIVYCKPDSGSARRVSQANQILPVKDYVCCEGADQASSQKLEMKKFTNILSRSPPSFILQECLRNNTGSAASSSEKQQRSPLSAQAFEQTDSQSRNSMQATQNMVNGNIQHKGQYYFVTGVCKPSEPSLKDSLSGVNAKEDHGHLKNKEVSFNFRNDLPNQSQHKRQSSYEIPGVHGLKVYNESQSIQAWNGDQGYSNESAHSSSQTSPPRISKVPRSHSSEVPEPNPKAQSREIGYEFRRHHSSSHHIFYCGPEESDPPKQKEPVTSKDGSSARCVGFISNNGDREKRQPLGDVANDKINKETTPMLYHLTGESGGAFTYKTRNENEPGNWKSARQSSGPFSKHKEAYVVERAHPISRSFCLSEGAEDENQDQGDTLCSSGSSLDDSYNKYYKEKIKDAQTKVLRETSFKRKDLQLSWPHRIKQKPSVRPSVIHSRASSLSSASDIGNDNPVHAGPEAKGKKEEKKLQDSQPQPARIGARKRLKPEQKKLCYSEPERLNQLEDLHGQSGHRPAGNEEEPSQEDFKEQGTVASRRKVFEKRGRTLSVSSISKNELKQIQHNALVEYMERKSGQKPAGPQQVPSQNPQRLSTPGRLADWGVTSSTGSGTQKQKRPRPLSAGRVLDSSSSSIRYARSPGFQSIESHNQPNRRQSATQAPGKSASMESLLDQPERIRWRARSKSSSSQVQIDKNTPDTSPLLDSTSYRLKTTHPVQCLGDPHQEILYWDSTQASSPASDSGVRTESRTSSPAKHAESAATEGRSEGAKPPLNSSTNAKNSATQLPVPPTGEMSSVVPSTAPAGEPVQDNSITNKAKPENEMEDKTGPHNPSLTKPPSKSAVEQRWEELATAIVAKDLSLAEVLVPESNRKTTLKLMEQLLSDDTLLTEEYYKRKEARRQLKESDENPEKSDSIPLDTPGTELLANTSEEQKTTQDAQGDPSDVTEKKKALIVNIKWKLQCLEEQKEELGADLQRNSVLGVSVETAVRNSCRPNEYERYTLFIGDLEKVVKLLLCLSYRLARVENALSQVNQDTDPEDKQSLNERHRLLCRQHEDAKDLKENLLRREHVVSEILLKHLSQQQLQDYKHFVKVKASLLIEQKDLDERVRVSEEQLESLQNSIPPK